MWGDRESRGRKWEDDYGYCMIYTCAEMSQCKTLICTPDTSYNRGKAGSEERTDQERQAWTTYQGHSESSYKSSTVDAC